MDIRSKIILIAGPTSSGKSEFAYRIAKKINGEIVNADSMQVYKEIKILNARPSTKLVSKIKHHLYGIISVKKNFSTGTWLKLAIKKIEELRKKNKIPIIVGGTGLYFRALTNGLVKIPKISKKIRYKLIKEQKRMGQEKFYKKLIKVDPAIKNKINENDVQRSIRAYEIKLATGKSLFDWFTKTKPRYSNYEFIKLIIDFPRSELIKKIESRTEQMIKSGGVKEVKKFKNLHINPSLSSNKIIGIKEISDFLDKKTDLTYAKQKISIKTRQYAKRQATWSRSYMADWTKIPNDEIKIFVKNFKQATLKLDQ